MKKLTAITLLALSPFACWAENADTQSDYTNKYQTIYEYNESYPYKQNKPSTKPQSGNRFFVEYYISLFSNYTTEEELSLEGYGKYEVETDETKINQNGMFAIGLDFDGIQLAFAPAYHETETASSKSFELKLDAPIGDSQIKPYLSLGVGIGMLSADDLDIDNETGFTYGIGGGIMYEIDNNAFMKFGILYQSSNYDIDLDGSGYDDTYKIEASGFSLITSIGYKF